MSKTIRFGLGLALALLMAVPASAQFSVLVKPSNSVAGFSNSVSAGSTCILTKYVGSTAGRPTVEVASTGDITFKLAGSADTTTGSPNLDGVYDLSTPAAAVDTMGELVNVINTTGSNWRAVLVSCLASDLTDNALFTLSATDAAGPKGVQLMRESTSASATSVFSAQVAAVPSDAASNIQFWLNSAAAGYPASGKKINNNPFDGWQAYVQNVREKITSSGTVALAELLAVKRVYDANGKVSDTVRTIWSETGAASTSEKAKDYNSGPLVLAPGEMAIWRQRTATDLTVESIGVTGYIVRTGP